RVYALDAGTGAILGEILLPYGSGPTSIAISRGNGTQALVTLFRSGKLAVIDTINRALVRVIDLGWPHPFSVSYVTTANRAWVAHAQLDGEHSFMAEIDTAAMTVSARLFIVSTNPKFLNQIPSDPVPIPEGGYIFLHSHFAQPPGSQSGFLWVPLQY